LLYQKPGQIEEHDIFGNQAGSPEYEEFLHFLGDKIELKGWSGYAANLDSQSRALLRLVLTQPSFEANTTGKHSVFHKFHQTSVMFHVATLLPHTYEIQQVRLPSCHLSSPLTSFPSWNAKDILEMTTS